MDAVLPVMNDIFSRKGAVGASWANSTLDEAWIASKGEVVREAAEP